MTVAELVLDACAVAESHAPVLLIAAVITPILGTIAGRIGKAGSTDEDGRALASGLEASRERRFT